MYEYTTSTHTDYKRSTQITQNCYLRNTLVYPTKRKIVIVNTNTNSYNVKLYIFPKNGHKKTKYINIHTAGFTREYVSRNNHTGITCNNHI
jgi:CMP-N-acetylneuraminic acid synthetase